MSGWLTIQLPVFQYLHQAIIVDSNCMRPTRRLFLLLAFAFSSLALSAQVNIQLLSQMYVQDSSATDVWGYVDANTGREYALVGSWGAVSIIDVTDPANPVYAAFMDSIPGFDIKVWDHYFYAVDGRREGRGYVVDLTDPANPRVAGRFPQAHNIFIDDKGFLFSAFPSLQIFDLNQTPESPALVYSDTNTTGHDVLVVGDTAFFFEGYSGTYILNVADRSNPKIISQIFDPQIIYAHSGWITKDRKYLFINDELAKHPTPDITLWDISDFSNPTKVAVFGDSTSIVHNIFIIDNYAYVSYYQNGFRIFDVSDPPNFQVAAHYETFPDSTTENFGGAFGVYPFAPSGNIYISDMTYGLFVLDVELPAVGIDNPAWEPRIGLDQVWPNPSAGSVQVSGWLQEAAKVKLEVWDMQGRLVRTVFEGQQAAGALEMNWDGMDQQGQQIGAGTYFLHLSAGGQRAIRKVVRVE